MLSVYRLARRVFVVGLLCFVATGLTHALHAQQISGTVTDTARSAVPKAGEGSSG